MEINQKNKQFTEIYKDNYQPVFRYIMAQMFNRAEAEDVASKTFTIAYEKFVNSDEKIRSYKTWLIQIARNIMGNEFKKIKPLSIDEKELNIKDDSLPLDVVILNQDEIDDLKREFSFLSNDKREIIVLKLWEDYNFEDIAEVLKLNVSAVKMRYYRGLEELKEKLKDKFKEKSNIKSLAAIVGGFKMLKNDSGFAVNPDIFKSTLQAISKPTEEILKSLTNETMVTIFGKTISKKILVATVSLVVGCVSIAVGVGGYFLLKDNDGGKGKTNIDGKEVHENYKYSIKSFVDGVEREYNVVGDQYKLVRINSKTNVEEVLADTEKGDFDSLGWIKEDDGNYGQPTFEIKYIAKDNPFLFISTNTWQDYYRFDLKTRKFEKMMSWLDWYFVESPYEKGIYAGANSDVSENIFEARYEGDIKNPKNYLYISDIKKDRKVIIELNLGDYESVERPSISIDSNTCDLEGGEKAIHGLNWVDKDTVSLPIYNLKTLLQYTEDCRANKFKGKVWSKEEYLALEKTFFVEYRNFDIKKDDSHEEVVYDVQMSSCNKEGFCKFDLMKISAVSRNKKETVFKDLEFPYKEALPNAGHWPIILAQPKGYDFMILTVGTYDGPVNTFGLYKLNIKTGEITEIKFNNVTFASDDFVVSPDQQRMIFTEREDKYYKKRKIYLANFVKDIYKVKLELKNTNETLGCQNIFGAYDDDPDGDATDVDLKWLNNESFQYGVYDIKKYLKNQDAKCGKDNPAFIEYRTEKLVIVDDANSTKYWEYSVENNPKKNEEDHQTQRLTRKNKQTGKSEVYIANLEQVSKDLEFYDASPGSVYVFAEPVISNYIILTHSTYEAPSFGLTLYKLDLNTKMVSKVLNGKTLETNVYFANLFEISPDQKKVVFVPIERPFELYSLNFETEKLTLLKTINISREALLGEYDSWKEDEERSGQIGVGFYCGQLKWKDSSKLEYSVFDIGKIKSWIATKEDLSINHQYFPECDFEKNKITAHPAFKEFRTVEVQ